MWKLRAITLASLATLAVLAPSGIATDWHKHSSQTTCLSALNPVNGNDTCSAKIRYISDPTELCPAGPGLGPGCCNNGKVENFTGYLDGLYYIGLNRYNATYHAQDTTHTGIHFNVSYAVLGFQRYFITAVLYDKETGEWGAGGLFPETVIKDSALDPDPANPINEFTFSPGFYNIPDEYFVINMTMVADTGEFDYTVDYNGPAHWKNNNCDDFTAFYLYPWAVVGGLLDL